MNNALAMTAETVSVSPDNRRWWTVRPTLLAVLGALLTLWTAVSMNQSNFQTWMVKDLPLSDRLIARVAGYSAAE